VLIEIRKLDAHKKFCIGRELEITLSASPLHVFKYSMDSALCNLLERLIIQQ